MIQAHVAQQSKNNGRYKAVSLHQYSKSLQYIFYSIKSLCGI